MIVQKLVDKDSFQRIQKGGHWRSSSIVRFELQALFQGFIVLCIFKALLRNITF